MHIKELTIFGFKSYQEKTSIENLCNGFNIIVGRNGSGKSNVFRAIEFVLSVAHTKLKAEARNELMSSGRQRTALDPAYVEIIFDNSDRKLPIDEDTVSFRRILGAKKDRFFVNGNELFNAKKFLDVAGFTNPYFIVKQGKVQDLALATDAQRLKIITDVAGSGIYDAKIAECKKFLEGGNLKRKEIEESLEELRLEKNVLKIDADDLKHFQHLDQSRRAIEFVINERKIRELQKNIDEFETLRTANGQKQRPLRNELEKIRRNLQIYRRDIGDMEQRRDSLEELKKQYETSRNEIAETIAIKNQQLEDLNSPSAKYNVKGSEGLEILDKDIIFDETQLQKVEKELEQLKNDMMEHEQEKHRLNVRIKALTEQENKKSKFRKSSELNKHLEAEARKFSKQIQENKKAVSTSEQALKNFDQSLENEREQLKTLKDELSSYIAHVKKACQNVESCRTKEFDIKNRLETIWRQSSEVEQKYLHKRHRMDALDENLRKAYGNDTVEGWIGVKKIIEDFKEAGKYPEVVEGYYGLVCENFQCDAVLDIAVEVAAGHKLVHHVVQSAHIAQIILKEFNARRCRGAIHFIPVSNLRTCDSQDQVFSLEGLQGAKPMMNVIEITNDVIAPALTFIFGKTLLCDSLQCAVEMMRKFKRQCVTIEGEKVSGVGVITGGYIRPQPQKMELQRAKSKEEQELLALAAEKATFDRESDQLKEELRSVKQKFSQYSAQKSKLEAAKRSTLSSIETLEKKMANIKENMKEAEMTISENRVTIIALQERIKVARGETSEGEVETMKQFRAVSEAHSKAAQKYASKQNEKSKLEAKLQRNKQRQYRKLEASFYCSEEVNENEAASISNLIKSLTHQLTEMDSKIKSTKDEFAKILNSISQKQKIIDESAIRETKLNAQLGKMCAELDSLTKDHAVWSSKLREYLTAAENLGSVGTNLEKIEACGENELCSKLKKINTKLKDINNKGVNLKAIEQYSELSRDLSGFEERLKTAIQEGRELSALLQDLETKRGETMLNNIRDLQVEFKKKFQEVVPRGNAELIVYGKDVTISSKDNIESDNLRNLAGQNQLEGAKILVNFLGKRLHDQQTLSALSGGQKSIIALCLILAIQTIDPVPFYLFDEVDQALDPAYRDSVAQLIGRMSEQSQFICTTFRKEFIDVSDKIYGVSFRNRCSTIQPISAAQAFEFIESDSSTLESNGSDNNNSDNVYNNDGNSTPPQLST